VTASAHAQTVTVKVKPSVAGRVQVAVQRPDRRVLASRSVTVGRGKVKTLKFQTSCKACARVKVVGTLTAGGSRPVQSSVAVRLDLVTETTTTSTSTSTAGAPAPTASTAPAAAPAPTKTSVTTTSSTTTTQAPAPAPAPTVTAPPATPATGGSTAAPLTWAPPTLSNPITVNVSASNRSLRLDGTRDYLVKMPATALSGANGLVINGGHHVVLVGGEIDIPWQGDTPPVNSRRGLYLQNQTGTIHIEGLYIHGSDLSEGIDLDERLGATVQIQNTRVENVHARDEVGFTDNHPDLIQTWAGPALLRVDHFSGTSDYQGFFFAPMQFGSVPPTLFDLRHIDISATLRAGEPKAGVLLWQSSSFPMNVSDLYLVPDKHKGMWNSQWPNPSAWGPGVQQGVPAAGSFATGAIAGAGYRSAGYGAA
jgi:hypothetical protein